LRFTSLITEWGRYTGDKRRRGYVRVGDGKGGRGEWEVDACHVCWCQCLKIIECVARGGGGGREEARDFLEGFGEGGRKGWERGEKFNMRGLEEVRRAAGGAKQLPL